MASILPTKKQTLGFNGLIEPGEQSHWAFYVLLYISCLLVLLLCFSGIYLSKGSFLISMFSSLVLAGFLYLFAFLAESGKVSGNNLIMATSIIGLLAIAFIASYLGNHYLHNAARRDSNSSNLVEQKLIDLNNSEKLITFYHTRYNQLNLQNSAFRNPCDYSILDSTFNMSNNWKMKVQGLQTQLMDPLCFLLHRDEILNNDKNGINFSHYKEVMVHDINKHNEAWVANAKCQVNIPIDSEFVGLETKLNTQPPEISSTWKSLKFSLFLLFGVSISLLALMPFFAAKSAETILKSR
jgi:hypothetical protein